MNNRNHRQILIEQLRRQSIQKRTQALKEAVQKQAMNAPIAGASSSGGGSSSSPGGTGESTISSGIVKWSWDGAPVLREPNIWDVTGTITGFTLDNIPADTLTGDFMLTFDSLESTWGIRNSGAMILSASAPPISTNVSVLSISDAKSEDNPSSDLTGTFDDGSINGVVIYNAV